IISTVGILFSHCALHCPQVMQGISTSLTSSLNSKSPVMIDRAIQIFPAFQNASQPYSIIWLS
ncbi:MAG: hypothetical protein ACTSPS_20505, partial [Promethearchaeota archaeon]